MRTMLMPLLAILAFVIIIYIFICWLPHIAVSNDIDAQIVPIPKLESAEAECDKRGMGFAMKMDEYSLYCYDRTVRQVYYFNTMQ